MEKQTRIVQLYDLSPDAKKIVVVTHAGWENIREINPNVDALTDAVNNDITYARRAGTQITEIHFPPGFDWMIAANVALDRVSQTHGW